jgi:hypothetical protein
LRRGNCCVVVFLQVIIDYAAHFSFNGNCDGFYTGHDLVEEERGLVQMRGDRQGLRLFPLAKKIMRSLLEYRLNGGKKNRSPYLPVSGNVGIPGHYPRPPDADNNNEPEYL